MDSFAVVDMSQEDARKLFANGAMLVILNMPMGTEFGIDSTAHKVGEKFRGVKMIPPGVHYVYASAQGVNGDSSNRVGFIHHFRAQEIVIREWSEESEELTLCQRAAEEAEAIKVRDNLEQYDK